MKKISNFRSSFSRWAGVVISALALAAPLHAQQPKTKFGFIRMVNAVAQGTGKLFLIIDGKNVYPAGYEFGNVTGGIGLSPGMHSVTIKREGILEGTTKVSVEADDTTTIIPFAEKVPASDVKEAHWAMRILRLKQKQVESGRTATFVSVSSQPELKVELAMPGGGWDATYVKRLSTAQLPIRIPESYVPVLVAGQKMPPIQIGAVGNYVTVIYDGPDGVLHALNFQDVRFLTAD